jgi:hypothetical protein
MSRIGQSCIVVSHPPRADFPVRAAIITAEYKDGTVDVTIFNPHSEGPASVRETSMPVVQSMGPIPLARVNEKMPADYRGKWVAVMHASALMLPASLAALLTDEEKQALLKASDGDVASIGTVAKPIPGNKAKR